MTPRVLLCHPGPDFSVHDVFNGWHEGLLANGAKVLTYNLHDRLAFYDHAYIRVDEDLFRKAVEDPERVAELAVNGLAATLWKTRPDILVVVSGFMVPADLLDRARRDGVTVVAIHTEQPYETGREAEFAQHADVNIVNDPTHIDRFPAGTWYQPHCYRPEIHHPGAADPDLRADLAFVGTGFESRIVFFSQMAPKLRDLDVLLAGNWQRLDEHSLLRKWLAHDRDECLDNEDTARVYRSATVGLNLYRREHQDDGSPDGWAIGPREVEMAACGLPFLRDPREEGDRLFPNHLRFTSADEAADGLRWWLANPTARELAASQARAAVADRTFDQAAARLLAHIENN